MFATSVSFFFFSFFVFVMFFISRLSTDFRLLSLLGICSFPHRLCRLNGFFSFVRMLELFLSFLFRLLKITFEPSFSGEKHLSFGFSFLLGGFEVKR